MTLVIDASVVIAALLDTGTEGTWAEHLLESDTVTAPHVMPIEAANILRRAVLRGDVSDAEATVAHHDLLALPVALVPYASIATRAWELRGNLTLYDACYVALAEALDTPLATLDRKLTRAPGIRCKFRVP